MSTKTRVLRVPKTTKPKPNHKMGVAIGGPCHGYRLFLNNGDTATFKMGDWYGKYQHWVWAELKL